jgi:hypothetical protein
MAGSELNTLGFAAQITSAFPTKGSPIKEEAAKVR